MNVVGTVSANLDPLITLEVSNGMGGRELVEAVLDSGFNDFISLPIAVIQRLQLQSTPSLIVELADGSEVETPTYVGRIFWDGIDQIVRVQEGEGRPLVGMALMIEHRITIDVRYDGAVLIEPIADDEESD